LKARFAVLATEAGIALGSPPGISPLKYWLYHLYVDLRAENSELIDIDNERGGFVERVFEASAIYCAWLDRGSLEIHCNQVNQEADIKVGRERAVQERSARRRAVVLPILGSKKWTRGRLVTQAGVSKNCVYEYLNGKRNLSLENRQAVAEELGLTPEDLPD
jgi:hypothetical protein